MANRDGHLPAVHNPVAPAVARRAQHAQERAELELYGYSVRAWTVSMMDQIDTAALGEAIRASAEEEMDTYDEMMLIAGDSHVKQQIVLRKLAIMTNADNARLRRRFR